MKEKHKKESNNIEKLRCSDVVFHNIEDLKPETKCKWCGKEVRQLEEEYRKKNQVVLEKVTKIWLKQNDN